MGQLYLIHFNRYKKYLERINVYGPLITKFYDLRKTSQYKVFSELLKKEIVHDLLFHGSFSLQSEYELLVLVCCHTVLEGSLHVRNFYLKRFLENV